MTKSLNSNKMNPQVLFPAWDESMGTSLTQMDSIPAAEQKHGHMHLTC